VTPAPRAPEPPRHARWLLRHLLHRDDRDAAVSDLDEEFESRARHAGEPAAARWYRVQVLRSLVPAFRRRWAGRARLPLATELRWAWRGIRSRGVGAPVYVGLVAAAVGASTLAFSAADAFVFHRAPYPNADRVVLFDRTTPVGVYSTLQPDESDALRKRPDLVTGLYSHYNPSNGPTTVTIDGHSESVWLEHVVPGLLDALGVLPVLGRPLADADGRAGAEPVAVIAWALATRRFGEPAAALGQFIQSGREALRIVGVMPEGFQFPRRHEEIWRPLSNATTGFGVGLLAPGQSVAAVQHALDAHASTAAPARPGPFGPIRVVPLSRASRDPRVVTNSGAYTGDTAPALFTLLFAAALCLTAVACLNLVSVELASALIRAPVHAVQTALGATRGVLVRTSLLEGLILTSAGAGMGSVLAVWGAAGLESMLPRALDTVLLNDIDVDPRAAAFMAVIAGATWLAASAPLVWFTSRAGLASVIRRAPRISTASRAHISWRQAIVTTQVTLTVMLAGGALVFLRPYAAAVTADRGFDSTNLATISVSPRPDPSVAREDRARVRDLLRDDLIAGLRAHQGVVSVAPLRGVPPGVSRASAPSQLWIEGAAASAGLIHIAAVNGSPDFLSTLGLRLLAGRTFRPGDSADQVVVDEAFARRFWPDGNALGVRYSLGTESTPGETQHEIIGIASHLRAGRAWSGKPVFVVHSASSTGLLDFVVRLDAMARLGDVTELVRSLVPGAAVRTTVVARQYADMDGDTRIAVGLTSSCAALAFLVAVAGIYGVTAFVVAGRTREIGIRLALGATAPDIRRSILRPTMRVVGVGLVVGVVAALLASRWIASQPIGVTGASLTAHAAVALLVAVAALVATLRPTRRASHINPAITLRAE
jgi:predicted permease